MAAVGVGDAEERDPGQAGQDAGVIGTHGANADDADSQRRARLNSLHHSELLPLNAPAKVLACPPAAGDDNLYKEPNTF